MAASGIKGLRTVNLPLAGIDTTKELTVRLYFCEPEYAKPGSRAFSVSLDGRQLLSDFDIVKESGGPCWAVVKQFGPIGYSGRRVEGYPAVELTFQPKSGQPLVCGIEVIEDVRESVRAKAAFFGSARLLPSHAERKARAQQELRPPNSRTSSSNWKPLNLAERQGRGCLGSSGKGRAASPQMAASSPAAPLPVRGAIAREAAAGQRPPQK